MVVVALVELICHTLCVSGFSYYLKVTLNLLPQKYILVSSMPDSRNGPHLQQNRARLATTSPPKHIRNVFDRLIQFVPLPLRHNVPLQHFL